MRTLGLFLCLLISLSVIADDHWVVDLKVNGRVCATGFTIGRLPDHRSILITSMHVLAAAPEPFKINGSAVERNAVIGMDADSDIAAMIIPWDGEIGILSDIPPTPGLKIMMEGSNSGVRSGMITRIGNLAGVDFISQSTEVAFVDFTSNRGDSGGPVVGPDRRVVSIHSFSTEGALPGYGGGPTVKVIKDCLLKWGWKCQNGKCIRINPLPRQPITPQPPPAKWEPITSIPRPILPGSPSYAAEIDRIFDRLDDLAAKIGNPPTSPESNDSKLINDINAVSKATMAMGKRIDQIQTKSPNDPIETNKGSGIVSRLPWGMILTGAASAAGVGLPVWAVMVWKGARAAKRFRNHDVATSGEDRTIVVDAPPSQNRIFESTRFVNVESDHHRSAYEWAKGQTVRRYPGSQEIFASNDSLIGQYITANLKG